MRQPMSNGDYVLFVCFCFVWCDFQLFLRAWGMFESHMFWLKFFVSLVFESDIMSSIDPMCPCWLSYSGGEVAVVWKSVCVPTYDECMNQVQAVWKRRCCKRVRAIVAVKRSIDYRVCVAYAYGLAVCLKMPSTPDPHSRKSKRHWESDVMKYRRELKICAGRMRASETLLSNACSELRS